MSYTVSSVNGCTKKIVFDFKTLDLTTEIKNALVKKQRESNLKGFRKGKAPLAMVEKLFKPQIETEALNQFVQTQFYEAVGKEKLKIVGYPSVDNLKYEPGKSASFDAVVEVFPEVALKDMSKLSFKKEKVEFKEEELEALKKNYLASKAQMTEVTDKNVALDKGLFAVMNFEGEKENGERPENMKGTEFLLEIGSGQFIPGFEEGMLGMKAGEKREVKLTFPKDYHVAELQNAKVKFDVELLEIKERKLPEFTDEVAKEFGFDSAQAFMDKNRENLKTQKEKQAKEKLHQEILEKLVEENKFDVPSTLVVQQEGYLREDLAKTLKQQGFNEKMISEYFVKWQDDVKKKAEFQVRSGLILEKLSKEHNIEANEKDLEVKVEETAKTTGIDAEQIRKYYSSNENIKRNMMYAIREEKTFSKILEKVKVS